MKSVQVKSPFEFRITEIETPVIADNQVLIEVKACGICGTDIHTAASQANDWQTFGHEVSGVVSMIGNLVNNVLVGDNVLIESSTFCRYCEDCRNGRVDLCNRGPSFKWGTDLMGFGEYMIVPMEQVVKFEGISFEEASVIEPMGVAMDLAYTADIRLNDNVLVIGLGPIGLIAIRLAKLMGAKKIYAAEFSNAKKRIQIAKSFGADEIIEIDKISIEDYNYSGNGVDKILITAPPRVIPSALSIAKTGATIAFLGIEFGENAKITFDANMFHFKKLQLRGSYASPALYFPRCIDLVKSGMVDLKSLISGEFSIDNIENAFKTLINDKENSVKMVMVNKE